MFDNAPTALAKAEHVETQEPSDRGGDEMHAGSADFYVSADVETDGPIPGAYSILSFALVPAGSYDGTTFQRPTNFDDFFYCEFRPISDKFQSDALAVNKLDRERLIDEGEEPSAGMDRAYDWIMDRAQGKAPVLVAYPLSFDWSWLFWYFTAFCDRGSPFNYSRCFDIKTAISMKTGRPISASGRSKVPAGFASSRTHTHWAVDDAIEQAEIFANLFDAASR